MNNLWHTVNHPHTRTTPGHAIHHTAQHHLPTLRDHLPPLHHRHAQTRKRNHGTHTGGSTIPTPARHPLFGIDPGGLERGKDTYLYFLSTFLFWHRNTGTNCRTFARIVK